MDIVAVISGLVGAVVGGLIAGGFTLLGVSKAGEQARMLATEDAARRDAEQLAGRRREWDMAGLAETREVLIAHLSWLERRVLTDPTNDRDALDIDDKTRSNINLVGDAAVIQEYSQVVAELSDRMPMTRGEAAKLARSPTIKDLDVEMISRTSAVRAHLLKALDEQELRVIAGQPVVELSPDELAKISGPAAILDALRERQRAASADHDVPPVR